MLSAQDSKANPTSLGNQQETELHLWSASLCSQLWYCPTSQQPTILQSMSRTAFLLQCPADKTRAGTKRINIYMHITSCDQLAAHQADRSNRTPSTRDVTPRYTLISPPSAASPGPVWLKPRDSTMQEAL